MKKIYRIIDANINRISEGLRVLEDMSRFLDDDSVTANALRSMRHQVRKGFETDEMIAMRYVPGDVGLVISQTTDLDHKSDTRQLRYANMKRVQEGLRSLEEHLKVLGELRASKHYESLRYESYHLEKKLIRSFAMQPDIYLILGERFSKGRSNSQVLEEALKAGIRVVQYREKEKTKKEQASECHELIKITKAYNALFLVNDHVDIAISVGADGVHLGQEDMTVEEIRRIAPDLIIGKSTHNMDQVQDAVASGADYIGVGPIFPTQTKKNLEECEGLSFLKEVSESVDIPYVAIGGIKAEHVKEITELGAACAMITEIVGADNILEKVKELKENIGNDIYNTNGCR